MYGNMRDVSDRDEAALMVRDSMCISPTVRHVVPMQHITTALVPACRFLKAPQSLRWKSAASMTLARQEIADAEPAVPGWRMPVNDLFG
jgi:hypothetical protein